MVPFSAPQSVGWVGVTLLIAGSGGSVNWMTDAHSTGQVVLALRSEGSERSCG